MNNDARIAWIRQERWIQYPRAKRILERLADLVDYPPHDRMPCLVIYGGTGMGKTRVVQKCPRDNRAHFDGSWAEHVFLLSHPDATRAGRAGPVRRDSRCNERRVRLWHERYNPAASYPGSFAAA